MSSGKWLPFCLGLNVLRVNHYIVWVWLFVEKEYKHQRVENGFTDKEGTCQQKSLILQNRSSYETRKDLPLNGNVFGYGKFH